MERTSAFIPELPVADLDRSICFYRDLLGFRVDEVSRTNEYAALSRGSSVVWLTRAGRPPPAGSLLVLPVADARALCSEWRAKGVALVAPLVDTGGGTREFAVEDGDGHRLRVVQKLDPARAEAPAPADGVRVVKRLPSTSEYQALVEAAGWTRFVSHEVAARSLSRSLFSVVAELDGRCLGMARVSGDGALYFLVLDVAVRPPFQRRGVGTRMMNEVVEFLRASAPDGALVGLFAAEGKSRFFARFGFTPSRDALAGMCASSLVRA